MLIDSTHKHWFLATVLMAGVTVAVYLAVGYFTPGGLTGGSSIGLWYGVLGTALMIYAGLLAAHRKLPVRTWIGPRRIWLKGHLWMGTLSGVFLLCHSGFRWGGPVEFALSLAVIGVLFTGIVGAIVQQFLPRLMTIRAPAEGPYEQIPHLCQVMRRKADTLVDAACGPFDPRQPDVESTRAALRLAEDGKAQLRAFFEQDIRPFLNTQYLASSPLANPLQAEARFGKLLQLHSMEALRDQIDQLATLCEERRQLAGQERLHFWLHAWLMLHVPLSIAVLVLGAIHITTALYY